MGHVKDGLIGYLMIFFAIWWAWMNFTWFASAYDTDDIRYRLLTFVQIAGVLVIAAGVPAAMDRQDYTAVTLGYVLLRLSMVVQWLTVAADDPAHRFVARRYAVGVAAVQVGWLLRLLLPAGLGLAGFVLPAIAEISVPILSERGSMTTWHREHIAERPVMVFLVVLGAICAALLHRPAVAVLATVQGVVILAVTWWVSPIDLGVAVVIAGLVVAAGATGSVVIANRVGGAGPVEVDATMAAP
jgi:low temperature requirement protein LtrA